MHLADTSIEVLWGDDHFQTFDDGHNVPPADAAVCRVAFGEYLMVVEPLK